MTSWPWKEPVYSLRGPCCGMVPRRLQPSRASRPKQAWKIQKLLCLSFGQALQMLQLPSGTLDERCEFLRIYFIIFLIACNDDPPISFKLLMTLLTISDVRGWLHLRHSSLSNPSAVLPTSQLVLKPFRCFTYVICTSPTSQLIFQPFRRFIYASAHSTTLPLLRLHHRHFNYIITHSPTLHPLYRRHSSFYSLSVASPTS